MGFPRLGSFWRLGIAAAALSGALALLPGRVGAQAPVSASLYPITAGSPGNGLVTLSGYNSVAVTINGVASGNMYNVFTCSIFTTTPTPAACQLAGAIFAGSGGQASAVVTSATPSFAIAEVFAQNANNGNELYEAVFSGGYAGVATAATGCVAGSPVVWVNGLPGCSLATTALAGCAQVVYIGGSAVCVPGAAPQLGYPWWWYYLYGYGVLPPGVTLLNACVPGAGVVPVFVNGVFVLEQC